MSVKQATAYKTSLGPLGFQVHHAGGQIVYFDNRRSGARIVEEALNAGRVEPKQATRLDASLSLHDLTEQIAVLEGGHA